MNWLNHYRIPYLPVITKSDKLSKNKQIHRRKVIAKKLGLCAGDLILFSAKTRLGVPDLWEAIKELLVEENDD